MLNVQFTGLEPDKRLRLLVCANQGAGKTLLSSTFPNPFFASTEAGLLSLQSRRKPYHEVKNSKEMDEIIAAIRQPQEIRQKMLGAPVETLVIDTVDAFQRLLKKERMRSKNADNFGRDDWGWLAEIQRSYLKTWMSLDVNLVITCHLGTETDQELGRIYQNPRLEGSFKGEIADAFDLVGIINAKGRSVVENGVPTKKIERTLQFFPEVTAPWLKDRSGKLPLEFPVNLEDDYDRMAALIFADWEKNKAEAEAELEIQKQKAIEDAKEVAAYLAESAPEVPKLQDLEKPRVVETISSDQFQELVQPFQTIADEALRKELKDKFVRTFGNPMQLPKDKLEEAESWITTSLKAAEDETPEPAVEEISPEVVASPPEESVVSEPTDGSPKCHECGVVIEDPDVAALSEMQYDFPYCAVHFKEKAKR